MRIVLFYRSVCLFMFLSFFTLNPLSAQDTFEQIYDLIQTNCTTCHDETAGAGNLSLTGDMATVYSNLVDTDPTNPAALADENKLISPGYPEKSYLFRKLSHSGFDDYYALDVPEGNYMPYTADPLPDEDIELVRQWILQGAPLEGEVVDYALINDYYNSSMGKAPIERLDAPAENEGFQVRLGPFFLPGGGEKEIFKKHKLGLSGDLEVNALDISYNNESHHFICYLYEEGTSEFSPEGLVTVDEFEGSMLDYSILAGWQTAQRLELPNGAAYFWDSLTDLNLNYHLYNFNPDSILKCEVYLNFYTQEAGTAEQEMITQLIPIDALEAILGTGWIGQSLMIPNDGQEHVLTDEIYIPSWPPAPDWHIWSIFSHTHKAGVDYDIYARNADGSKGEHIYEGFYNFDYTFNQGYYDWAHPPVRFFEPLKPITMHGGGGLIYEAKYVNNTDEPLYWGNTTNDEMMLFIIQYTQGPLSNPTGLGDVEDNEFFEFNAAPNPFYEQVRLSFSIEESARVLLEVYNQLGQLLISKDQGMLHNGNYNIDLDKNMLGSNAGVYHAVLKAGDKRISRKIILTD